VRSIARHHATGNVQVRLPDSLDASLEEPADELPTSRSDGGRRVLDEGLRAVRRNRALKAYAAGRRSLDTGGRVRGGEHPGDGGCGSRARHPTSGTIPEAMERDVERTKQALDEAPAGES
jgi:hypothetical protein